MNQSERRLYLIKSLLKEEPSYRRTQIPQGTEKQELLLRGLLNVRPPRPVDEEFLKIQDAYLQEKTREKGVTDLADLAPHSDGLYLWQGGITALKCDAIVNAANNGMTGCYIPNHHCIDNCIHTFSGVQLRLLCETMMEKQGFPEPTGRAKITPAFNLPCHYILHTVGPIVSGPLTETHCRQLADCYHSCLELASSHRLKSIAFCCISTGEFHFPREKAARIAIQSVQDYQKTDPIIKKVVFNVFQKEDYEIYKKLLTDCSDGFDS